MAFIRTKKRTNAGGNSYEYAYLVHNRWKKSNSSVKQKNKKYLGRVFRVEPVLSPTFTEMLQTLKINDLDNYIEKTSYKNIILDLVKAELLKNNFKENGEKILTIDSLFFDPVSLEPFSYTKKRKIKVVLALNEGFLCTDTIKKILNFDEVGDAQEVGFKLAKRLVDAGLKVPEDIFVKLFHKVYK